MTSSERKRLRRMILRAARLTNRAQTTALQAHFALWDAVRLTPSTPTAGNTPTEAALLVTLSAYASSTSDAFDALSRKSANLDKICELLGLDLNSKTPKREG